MQNIANAPLNPGVEQPGYPRNRLKTRIVHLGFGAFHRAHQALYTHDLARCSDSDWGICEVNLFRGGPLIEHLQQQDHLYSVLEKDTHGETMKIIGCVTESYHAGTHGSHTIVEKMAHPDVAIVSLTVTEKGYCVDAATGELDPNHPLIVADLKTPHTPTSAIGYLVAALQLRKQRGLSPFTVMSCDNIQGNGHVVQKAVTQFAAQIDAELSAWIASNTTFPCTMVDRIVPAATQDTLNEITQHLGVADPCGIACESFRQWVIEDNFVSGRPDWDKAGAQFVSDVMPYEEMKLRMLNGSHSFLAYLGYLAGYTYISDTMVDEHFCRVTRKMMIDVQAPSLTMPAGTDLVAYADQLLDRFSNPGLKHRTWQIAMDGSQKISQRLLGSLRYHLAHDNDITLLATAIAGWIRYITGTDEQGEPIEVQDPMKERFSELFAEHGTGVNVVPVILGLESIFPTEIGSNERVRIAVGKAYQSLLDHGAKATIAAL
jgi:fructuronate reductase